MRKRSKLRKKRRLKVDDDLDFQIEVVSVQQQETEDEEHLTYFIYDVADGDKDDPSTNIERHLAIFDTLELKGSQDLIGRIEYDYDWSVKGALHDLVLRYLQEADRDAEEHKRESEQLMNQDSYYTRSAALAAGGVTFDDFCDAIDRVADNREDEEAWQMIENWRDRQSGREQEVRL